MKILLTGASGLVGAAVARQAAAGGHEVIGLVGRWAGPVPGATVLHSVDLAEKASVADWVRRTDPDAIVNAAAISEPAACETDPVLSQAMNVTLPASLAVAATAGDRPVRLVHISSEQVFDGDHPPYSIASPPRPINLYGRQKLASEKAVLDASPLAAVVRAPLLLGNSLSGRRSVHEKLLELWSGGGTARLYADEFRQVCTADNLAAALLELALQTEPAGLLHWAGATLCSRYEIGRQIAERFHLPPTAVARVWRADNPEVAARRPANLALDLAPLNRVLRVQPQPLAAALQTLVLPGDGPPGEITRRMPYPPAGRTSPGSE